MLVKAVIASAFLASGALANTAYGQCGGQGWGGDKTCPSGYTCVANGQYYSQCLPGSSGGGSGTTTTRANTTVRTTTTTRANTTTRTPTTSTRTTSAPAAQGTPGNTTRYWDCCKPSCSWPGKGSSSPARTCAKDGTTFLSDANAKNSCDGGSSYTCNSYQPFAVNDSLSYGFAAAKIAGLSESDWCCACYELTFTSGPVAGKKHVVQILNTGGDLGQGHFDLQIPGGGVGLFNGCSSQWGAPSSGWGAQYGGISSASQCSQLPSQLQSGCNWRFNWFKNADNPSVTFRKVTCPSELTSKSGCSK
ncbi:hypothetical protein HK097_011253 [Rhizophlyctis rosea]|uniref:Cellulase n=1 Tax=Rhizophlyctis rosea TaxID=64517 RepID=A0AAD5S6N5_9FUNG|nr:hypothetical protein HK097_011253 [Rhizophlyctis rosea]